MLAEGDKVVYRYSACGTHKGEFMGIASTGRQITFTGIVIARIADGESQEDWESMDGMYALRQLGAASTTQWIRSDG
jgi:predicted ester cyclase